MYKTGPTEGERGERGEREGTVNVFWNDVTARRSSDAKLNPSAAASELPNLS